MVILKIKHDFFIWIFYYFELKKILLHGWTDEKKNIKTLISRFKYVYFLCHWRRSSVFILNFEDISHLVLVFLLLTLNM